jgi:predicted ATPase
MAKVPIEEIRIAGFKSLVKETRLSVRPLTILAGANSSGKSSAMQPLLLLKQTLASPVEPSVLNIAGPNVQFTQHKQLFSHSPASRLEARTMQFGFTTSTGRTDLYYRLERQELTIQKAEYSFLRPEASPEPILLQAEGMSKAAQAALLKRFSAHIGQVGPVPGAVSLHVDRWRGFLRLFAKIAFPQGSMTQTLVSPEDVAQSLLSVIHIPGLRGNPRRDYPRLSTQGPRFDGHFQEYVAGIIASWKTGKQAAALGEALQQLGLTWKVHAQTLDATRVEIQVGRLKSPGRGGAKDLVSIADVGFGVSQVLPALVAMQVAEPGQLVYLEQPEIHLHPKAQRDLAKLLADAAKRDVRLLIETHSSILLRGIQTLVARDELDPKLVKLHWFSRDARSGETTVTSADLDEDGAFGADWPEDFDDTYLASESDYLDAVERRRRP